jgi:general secretion pathway protein D
MNLKVSTLYALLPFLILSSPDSMAQFKRDRRPKAASPAPRGLPQNTATNADNEDGNNGGGGDDSDDETVGSAQTGVQEKEFFGRDSGVPNANLPNVPNQYVNLNPETAFGPEVITSFDFPNAEILDLTKHMQKLTGINLILDKEIKGKISISAPGPITVGDAWKAYLAALNINGYTLVKSGAFYKIINIRDIRYTPTKIYTGNYTPNTENYVMRIIPLKNVNSAEVARSFRPFMSRQGRINEINQTNTIIMVDTGININRLIKLIKFIDVPGHEETLQIIQVKHSSAQEIATLLDKILKGQGSQLRSAQPRAGGNSVDISKIIAEPRTNSIIAMTNADGASQLRDLIKQLDVKLVSKGGGQIHVYYLNHGDAENLGKTLSTLVTNATSGAAGGAPRFAGPRTGSEPGGLFSSEVKITSDKPNNALVVMASPTDYLTIKQIIAKLDIPRDQVYVEGLIMETQVTNSTSFGTTLVGAYGSGGAQIVGSNPAKSGDLLSLLQGNITSLGGFFGGIGYGQVKQFTIGGAQVNINSINGLIKALASANNTNVLATPQILALDNEEAQFEVGETVPIATNEIAASGSTITSIKQQNVTMSLKLTPQINKVTRVIKLKINQKIDDFSNRAVSNAGGGVGTVTRQAITTVLVRDRDTIAMGGLMRDKKSETENKVPFLGDIPILGWLFKSRDKSTEKVNLLLFLTPKIISPYAKISAETVKDLLGRRSAHLKAHQAGNDPFDDTAQSLYQKANKQEAGPLYDLTTTQSFLLENEKTGAESDAKADKNNSDDAPGAGNEVEVDGAAPPMPETPNYKEISNSMKKQEASVNGNHTNSGPTAGVSNGGETIQAASAASAGLADKKELDSQAVNGGQEVGTREAPVVEKK